MRNRKAFTLIEVMMILIIFGILSVATMVAISRSMRGINLGGAADRIASDIRFAQTMASNTGKWYGIEFKSGPDQYQVFWMNGTVETLAENPANLNQAFSVNVGGTYSGVVISSVKIDGGTKVVFNPFGAPYTDKAGPAITGEGVVTLTNGAAGRSIHITPVVGRIYVQ